MSAEFSSSLDYSSSPATSGCPTVLQLISRLDGGGSGRIAIELSSTVSEAGGRALIAYDGEAATYELTRYGITPVEEKLTSRNPISAHNVVRRLAAVIDQHKIDIVHAQNASLAAIGAAAAKKAQCKLVTTFHDGPGHLNALTKKTRAAFASSDHIVTLSYLTANEIATAMPDLRSRISVVPYGVDLNRFDPARVAAQRVIQLATQWRLPDDRPVIMLPGRFAPQKGHGQLIEALAELKDLELRCIMVGPSPDGGAYREQLENKIRAHGLDDRIQLTDECRDMPAALMLADLVLAPYLDPSTYNRVLIEAQALGRPLVASDFPYAREMVEGSSMAWLAPAKDKSALAWAIRDALSLPTEEREIRAEQVIENLRQRSNRDVMCQQMLSLYANIAAGTATGDAAPLEEVNASQIEIGAIDTGLMDQMPVDSESPDLLPPAAESDTYRPRTLAD
jgi:glycosyltransferase involved in cell wall biosynthesis